MSITAEQGLREDFGGPADRLGTMRNNNIHRIASVDRHFDGIDWLERIDPGSHCREPTH